MDIGKLIALASIKVVSDITGTRSDDFSTMSEQMTVLHNSLQSGWDDLSKEDCERLAEFLEARKKTIELYAQEAEELIGHLGVAEQALKHKYDK